MKKIIALLLALTMIATFAVVVSAEDTEYNNDNWSESGNQDDNDVVIKVIDENGNVVETQTVYKVVVSWESLEFNFVLNDGVVPAYNEESHLYEYGDLEADAIGNWNASAANVTVTNHSNAEVTVDAAMEGNTSVEKYGVTATLTEADTNADVLSSAEGTVDGVQNTYTVSVAGVPQVLDFTLTTITVTIGTPDTQDGASE